MSTENSAQSGGIGLVGLLTIVFITLKLCHVIDWSWWWVLAPLWITAAIIAVVMILVVIVAVIADR